MIKWQQIPGNFLPAYVLEVSKMDMKENWLSLIFGNLSTDICTMSLILPVILSTVPYRLSLKKNACSSIQFSRVYLFFSLNLSRVSNRLEGFGALIVRAQIMQRSVKVQLVVFAIILLFTI